MQTREMRKAALPGGPIIAKPRSNTGNNTNDPEAEQAEIALAAAFARALKRKAVSQ